MLFNLRTKEELLCKFSITLGAVFYCIVVYQLNIACTKHYCCCWLGIAYRWSSTHINPGLHTNLNGYRIYSINQCSHLMKTVFVFSSVYHEMGGSYHQHDNFHFRSTQNPKPKLEPLAFENKCAFEPKFEAEDPGIVNEMYELWWKHQFRKVNHHVYHNSIDAIFEPPCAMFISFILNGLSYNCHILLGNPKNVSWWSMICHLYYIDFSYSWHFKVC